MTAMCKGCSRRLWAYVALLVVQAGFGCYGVVIQKFGKGNVDALVFSLIRDGFATPILLLASVLIEGWHVPVADDIFYFSLCGVFGMFGNQFLYIEGVYYAGSSIASVFQPLVPVFAAVIALTFGCERLCEGRPIYSFLKFLGITIASGGAVINVFAKPLKDSSNMMLGCIFLFGNTFCTAIYVIFQRWYIYDASPTDPRRMRWVNYPVSMTAWSYLAGALCMATGALVKTCIDGTKIWSLDIGKVIIPATYAVLISSSLCYALITFANKHLSSTITTASWPLQVFVAVYLGYVVFPGVPENELKPLNFVAGGCIIVGMFLVLFSDVMNKRPRLYTSATAEGYSDGDSSRIGRTTGDRGGSMFSEPPEEGRFFRNNTGAESITRWASQGSIQNYDQYNDLGNPNENQTFEASRVSGEANESSQPLTAREVFNNSPVYNRGERNSTVQGLMQPY